MVSSRKSSTLFGSVPYSGRLQHTQITMKYRVKILMRPGRYKCFHSLKVITSSLTPPKASPIPQLPYHHNHIHCARVRTISSRIINMSSRSPDDIQKRGVLMIGKNLGLFRDHVCQIDDSENDILYNIVSISRRR